MFGRFWGLLTTISSGYMIYNHLKNLDQMKNTLFHELSPEQQALWIKTFGPPSSESKFQMPLLPSLTPRIAQPPNAGTISQIQAGT